MVHQAYALTWLTVLCRKRGQVEEVREYASRGLVVGKATQLPEQVAMAQANQAWVAWRMGDLAEAEALGRPALDSWQRGQFVYAFHWAARLPLLAVALERSRVPEALEHARAMLDPLQQKLPDPLEAALGAAVEAGKRAPAEEARQHLECAVQVAQETGYL